MIATRARSGRSVLVNERLQAVRRLSVLLADLDGLDASGSDQLDELRADVTATLARISEIDQQLVACTAEPLDLLVKAQDQQLLTPRQKRVAARGRLQAVLLTLDGLPDSCSNAARLLRRAVKSELKKIEASRREEFTTGGS